jgi:hypothetical protein
MMQPVKQEREKQRDLLQTPLEFHHWSYCSQAQKSKSRISLKGWALGDAWKAGSVPASTRLVRPTMPLAPAPRTTEVVRTLETS